MGSSPRSRKQESGVRTALLDATERVLLEEGYGAVSARRVAREADVTLGLVHYYFGPMENLLVEVFRRRADWMLEQEAQALDCDQPLWALWDVTREYANTPLNTEFLALGNHFEKVHDELCDYSARFRQLQHDLVSTALAGRGVDTALWPPAGVMLLIDGMSRFLGSETMYGMSFGHPEATTVIERLITELEGPRKR